MTSLSTRFLGHPRLTKPIFCGRASGSGSIDAALAVFSREREIVGLFKGMLSGYFNISRSRPFVKLSTQVTCISSPSGGRRQK